MHRITKVLITLKRNKQWDWSNVAFNAGQAAAKSMDYAETRQVLRELREAGETAIASNYESGMNAGANDRRDARKKAKARAKRVIAKAKKEAFKKRHVFNVWVEYPVRGQMGISSEYDHLLFKAAGIRSNGSGSGFGKRDHDWNFKTKTKAIAVAKRLLKLKKKIRGLTVEVVEWKGDKHKTILGKRSKGNKLIDSFIDKYLGKAKKKPVGKFKIMPASVKAKPFAVMFNMSGDYKRHAMMYVGKKPNRKTASFATFAQAYAVAMALSKKNKAPFYFITYAGAVRGSMVKAVVHRGKSFRVKS
jgi:hypothetical protein